jgi:malonyl-CoA O-methyltransferase
MRAEEAALLALLPAVEGRTVLDAGCGTGRYARLVAARGAGRVICLDRSAAMIQRVESSVRRIRADFCALPIAARSIDVIVSGLALVDVRDLGGALREWSRVLRPGGVALCSTLHPRGAALGWARTFDTPAGGGCLPAFWHSLDDVRAACSSGQLEIDAVAEPALDQSSGEPVALVVRARR